jgi:Na+-translocating ferredoxin:NAD+ oxidoreductase RnfC subunit
MGELSEQVKAAGVVGAGGAGFPTHVKYQAHLEHVIANGAECEPLLYCDQTIMESFSDTIVEGVALVMKEVNARSGIIALKSKYKKALRSLEKALAGRRNMHLHVLENFYPAGDEQVLVYEVLKRVVPEGGIPLEVGVVVNNVATLMNVAEASKGKSVTHRWLTVHGEVRRPSTLQVPVGISIREVLNLAGGITASEYVVICGGPMTGAVQHDIDAPVTKTTSGIIVLPADHPHAKRKTQSPQGILMRGKSSCDQCMYCTELCPRYLLGHDLKPHLMMRAVPYGISDSEIITSAFLCCECGLCSYYACPLFLSPGSMNALFKAEMASKNIRNPHKRTDVTPYPFRSERRIPTSRLIQRLGLGPYSAHADMIETPYAPSRVRIPLKQHLGAPALPVVKVGDKVKAGELIGEIPEGKLGARVHASISGFVTSIDSDVIIEKS